MAGYLDRPPSDSERLISGGLIALLVIAAASFILPLTLSTATTTYVAFVIGGLGLGTSIAGFAFTIAQLRKTQGAAEAAATAIDKIKQDFGSLDAVAELQSVRSSIEGAQEQLAGADWPRSLTHYNRVREGLNRISALPSQLDEAEVEGVKDAIAHVHRACAELHNAGAAGSEFNCTDLSERLTEIDSFLVQIETKVRGRFGG